MRNKGILFLLLFIAGFVNAQKLTNESIKMILINSIEIIDQNYIIPDIKKKLTATLQKNLDNKITSPLEVQLEPHEQGFARQIQPLMSANDYQAIAALFKNRDLKNDGTALQLLRGQIFLMLKDLVLFDENF